MKLNINNRSESGLQNRPEQVSKEAEAGKTGTRFAQRAFNRSLPTSKVLERLARWMPRQFRQAERVGDWIWIRFPEMPPKQVRLELSELGFHWNARRQVWQHPCGKESAGANGDPKQKYGCQSLGSGTVS